MDTASLNLLPESLRYFYMASALTATWCKVQSPATLKTGNLLLSPQPILAWTARSIKKGHDLTHHRATSKMECHMASPHTSESAPSMRRDKQSTSSHSHQDSDLALRKPQSCICTGQASAKCFIPLQGLLRFQHRSQTRLSMTTRTCHVEPTVSTCFFLVAISKPCHECLMDTPFSRSGSSSSENLSRYSKPMDNLTKQCTPVCVNSVMANLLDSGRYVHDTSARGNTTVPQLLAFLGRNPALATARIFSVTFF